MTIEEALKWCTRCRYAKLGSYCTQAEVIRRTVGTDLYKAEKPKKLSIREIHDCPYARG